MPLNLAYRLFVFPESELYLLLSHLVMRVRSVDYILVLGQELIVPRIELIDVPFQLFALSHFL